MAPYGTDSQQFGMIALKSRDANSVRKAHAESGGLKTIGTGNDAFLTKAIAEDPARTDEFVSLVQKVNDAIDERLTRGVSFTRTTVDPFAAAGLNIADYYERRGGGTYTFRIQDLFDALDAYYGPGQVSANTPVG